MRFDVCIVGAGLIGLGVGHAVVERFPGVSVAILDKEPEVAAHQSSHNSGVLHSGLYYPPRSLKARLCIEGGRLLEALCNEESVLFRRTGKLVVAASANEVGRLDELERRGRANGLTGLRRLGAADIEEFEPEAVGVDALHVPSAGVVDFPGVARALRRRLEKHGALIGLGRAVERIQPGADEISVLAGGEEIRAGLVINCAGLHSDRVAALAGVKSKIRIVPFRGEYYTLAPSQSHLVKSLIYPVPDARFPFLGVHFTRGVNDRVEVGPNAVLAMGREHYRGARVDWADLRETITAGAFWRLVGRHWWTGTSELLRSRSRILYARSARRLVPAVHADHLERGGAGVRAQALAPNGRLIDDFVIQEVGSMIHILNAPSPGATASLAIGAHVATLAETHLRG